MFFYICVVGSRPFSALRISAGIPFEAIKIEQPKNLPPLLTSKRTVNSAFFRQDLVGWGERRTILNDSMRS